MKKLNLLLVLFILQVSISFSQEKDTAVYVTNTNTEKLIDKYTSKIEASIIALGQNLKQPVEHVYTVLIKQQKVRAWGFLVTNIVMFIIMTVIWVLWYLDYNSRDEWWGIPFFISLVFLALFFSSITMIITGFINPEYGAIKNIILYIK
jgi:hypothetical protein